jgi:DNA helicase-2/ATP-dependent DNA helicase PcrA
VIAYLRIIVNPRDELAWKRVLKMIPGVGNATANRIYERLSEGGNPTDREGVNFLTERVGNASAPLLSRGFPPVTLSPRLRESKPWTDFVALLELISSQENRDKPAKQIALILENGYKQYLLENYENADVRAEDIKGLALYAQRYDSTETFLSELALLSTERFKEPQPLVGEEVIEGGEEDELLTLTSVHQAKGLEWKAVFIIWAAEGKFPSPRSLREIEAEEEERRLWYVALTRAKDELYITYPLIMTDYNRQAVLQKPSRFVTECPPALFEIWDLEEEPIQTNALAAGGSSEFIN